MRMRSPFLAALAVASALLMTACDRGDSNAREAENITTERPRDPADKVFAQRIEAYLTVRRQAEMKVPELKETSDPAKITAREKAFGEAIRALRAGAKQGDVFAPVVVTELAAIVRDDFASRPPADRNAVLQEVPMKESPTINADYPTALPLATVPPALLLKLPTLPPELEYRFLGHHLILRDIKANVIVDYIPDAVPA
jgi:hypothetical protein